MKPIDKKGEKRSITFFSFANYESFSCTKIGVLYEILQILHKEYGQYIYVNFKTYDIDEVLEYKRRTLPSRRGALGTTRPTRNRH